MKMIFYTIFALMMVGVVADLDPQEIQCIEELLLNKAAISRLLEEDYYHTDNVSFMNFLGCYGMKTGIVNADGTVNWHQLEDMALKVVNVNGSELSVNTITAQFFKHTIDFCHKEYHGTNGQIVAKIHNCIVDSINSIASKLN